MLYSVLRTLGPVSGLASRNLICLHHSKDVGHQQLQWTPLADLLSWVDLPRLPRIASQGRLAWKPFHLCLVWRREEVADVYPDPLHGLRMELSFNHFIPW